MGSKKARAKAKKRESRCASRTYICVTNGLDPRDRPSRDRPTSAVGPHAVGMSPNQIATLAPRVSVAIEFHFPDRADAATVSACGHVLKTASFAPTSAG